MSIRGIIGDQGARGPQGITGLVGATGPQGTLYTAPEVVIVAPTGGDVLQYNVNTSKWQNVPATYQIVNYSTVQSFASTGAAYAALSTSELYHLDGEDILRVKL